MKSIKMLLMAAFTIVSMSAFSQDTSKHAPKSKSKPEKVTYVCPMHADVTSDKPGKCSKCGMDLKPQKKTAPVTYICLMHPEEESDEPGKCPKCGMDMVEKKKKGQAEHQHKHQ